MREIKFRAWDEKLKFMFCGTSLINLMLDNSFVKDGVERLKLMEYTCLKDKNGVEIYEGDICKITEKCSTTTDYNGNFSYNSWVNESKFEVVFNPSSLMNLNRFCNSNDCSCEVIGNVYEDCEFAKGSLKNE